MTPVATQSVTFLLHASSAYLNEERAMLLCTSLFGGKTDACIRLVQIWSSPVLGGNPGPVDDRAQQTSPPAAACF